MIHTCPTLVQHFVRRWLVATVALVGGNSGGPVSPAVSWGNFLDSTPKRHMSEACRCSTFILFAAMLPAKDRENSGENTAKGR